MIKFIETLPDSILKTAFYKTKCCTFTLARQTRSLSYTTYSNQHTSPLLPRSCRTPTETKYRRRTETLKQANLDTPFQNQVDTRCLPPRAGFYYNLGKRGENGQSHYEVLRSHCTANCPHSTSVD